MATSSSNFLYDPLEEGQIRLLRFLTEPAAGNETLRFELFHAKLSQRPQYTALSYSWGMNRKDALAITEVNGQEFPVTPNLAAALRRMLQNGISVIWVDAISIDQGNAIEKSKEVTRMFAIYRIAREVVVWLGQYEISGLIEDEVKYLHNLVEHTKDPAGSIKNRGHAEPNDLALAGLERMLKQPYWSRVWIIQEIAAARRTRIFWGPYSFELRPVELLVRDHGQEIEEGSAGKPPLAQQVLSVRAACRAQQKPRLMEILELTSASETSVLRDKVYGLLGLASDWADFVQEPNYGEDVSEHDLCLEMTANYINWYASVDIIFLRSTLAGQETLPSWCPDYFHFKVDPFDRNLVPYICGKDANLGWERRRAFAASARLNEEIPDSFELNGKKLTLRGVREGYITVVGGILHDGVRNGNVGDDEGAQNSFTGERSPSDIMAKAFRRLLLISHNQTFGHLNGMDFFHLLYALPKEYYQLSGHWSVWKWLDEHRQFFASFGLKLEPMSHGVAERADMRVRSSGLLDETRIPAAWKEYSSSGETSSRRRGMSFLPVLESIASVLQEGLCLMCISDGTLLGWAHRNAKVGDSIWHVEGCTLPAILRKSTELSELHKEDIYELVGHAYVDPVMASGRWLAGKDKGRVLHLL
ncbi:uncharacterized protein A1O9_05817 [Exophiala aquamarina CBS 119918]|uniref:Heterokaryon incompatibility domain-containing protein n=1 Tax=Exophiala aquamarina CBS 119918 TaxID=1182545 RepID=A0A072PDF6_9EURO|nr:uncharacterized protein A1O9_05817 [Exophiala aquamarina CBS 119918]KEF57896.1 hypothetical protein A1O9_05817 [Exophiala aquamarina CBS 119918]